VIEDEMSSVLLKKLAHGQADLVLVHFPASFSGLSTRLLGAYQVYVSTPNPQHLDTGSPLRLADLHGLDAITLPNILHPAVMNAMSDQLRKAGLRKVSEIEFSELLTVESRMRKTGEIMIGTLAPDSPIAAMLHRSTLTHLPLELDEMQIEFGLAWRSNAGLRRERLQRIIDYVHPTGKQPDLV
jgi:DNA-binding transcriptional LysR family regulator